MGCLIDINDLKHHIAARDGQGRPVLVREPVPAEFATASAVSRLTYRRAVQAEEQSVIDAARHANMPTRPPGYEGWSAANRRAWWLAAERGANR